MLGHDPGDDGEPKAAPPCGARQIALGKWLEHSKVVLLRDPGPIIREAQAHPVAIILQLAKQPGCSIAQ